MSNAAPRSFLPLVEATEAPASPPPTAPWRERLSFLTRGRFTLGEQIFFAKRLAFLAKAGVPLMESLIIIREQTSAPAKAAIYEAVIADVANGQALSAAIRKHPNFLTDFGINLIKVGETSGILEQNLAYLADELAKKDALRKKVIGAMVYPIFITAATLGVTLLLTVYIFPKIMPIFTSLHVPLPFTTRALIAVSAYLRDWGLLTLLALGLVVAALLAARTRYSEFRFRLDRLLLSLPLAASIARSYNLANFCRTMALMLKSGVPAALAMEIASDTTPNLVYKRAYARATECVVKGEPVSRQLAREQKIFPAMLTHLLAVGEKTGSLASTFSYLAEMYELEVDDQTKNLSSSIEPVLMMVMGLLVGLIAVSVITPIYGITQHLSPR